MSTRTREWLRLGLVGVFAVAGAAAIVGLAAHEMKLSQRYAHGAQAAAETVPTMPAQDAVAATRAPESAPAGQPVPSRGPEAERLARVDAAIADRDASRAIYEWREAYGAALRTRRWEALAAVGDAGARLEALLGGPGRYRPEARQAYLAALLRARAEGSPVGMRRAADGFAALGDEAAATQARLMAQRAS